MTIILLTIHILAALFWVGGMVFAHQILRPAALALDPPLRLALWRDVFSRFLPAVGFAVAALLVTGFAMIFTTFGGFAAAPVSVHVMTTTGLVMMMLYLHLVFAPWKRLKSAIGNADWKAGAGHLNQMRQIVGINIVLGIVTIVVASTGRYW
ncbi:CopD family protein [Pararhizobium haloflavum]|uniref:CopD family protein n=1 Tax=Pararhizobium haloflavum TaxID=2037914 RepID=UPI000C19F54C|nr:CopD family protein [Pararhizobium haloflavum]